MEELETALAQQAPPPPLEDPNLFELPPLIIDGIPTPVEKMTQAQLRAFIPLMLKYSTGRGKPGWGRESTRPPWWPKELPWANVRMDARTEEEKQKISWTHALRKIVINCYKYHRREDLLPAFSEEDEKANQLGSANSCLQTIQSNVSFFFCNFFGIDLLEIPLARIIKKKQNLLKFFKTSLFNKQNERKKNKGWSR